MLPLSKTLKPVASTSTSIGCSTPSAVRTPSGVIASIAAVSSTHVLAVEGADVLVGEARALAAEAVARRQLVAHAGILDVAEQLARFGLPAGRQERERAGEVGDEHERELDERLAEPARREHRARAPSAGRRAARALIGASSFGRHQIGVRWKTRQPLHLRRDRGDHLDRRGARADHGDALAAQLHRVVPARRVHRRPGERLDARDLGQLRLAEHARRADHVAGA